MGPCELLGKVIATLDGLQISYLVTGSVAAMAYGEPRMTNDIDIVAEVREQHNIPALLEAFPSEEYYISDEMIHEAIRTKDQFNIIQPSCRRAVGRVERSETRHN